ncbi:MAG: iron-sulfur cluster assembly accessory protein [Candidatus Eisenbacteria bacterium]|nr:iron-sulfur cluster assembly accessory protein [Candidatus Latescibacterota bacterium]MBD3303420.1 iron-sulfur cluster assembly accessory protein [Candidatus Eisenbacteria bacterium]
MAIEITDAAVAAVHEARGAEKLPEDVCLRVAVKGGGCSGFSYTLGFEPEPREEDRIIEKGGVRVLLDPKSESFLAGAVLDYTSGLNGKGFVFSNPNASSTCGCGNSFAV